MALPPQQLPARGPRAPPALQMLRDFVLPESFYPRAFAKLSKLLTRVMPFPASWIPWTAWAPPDAQDPPAGLAPLSALAPRPHRTCSIPRAGCCGIPNPVPRQIRHRGSASPAERPCPPLAGVCSVSPISRDVPRGSARLPLPLTGLQRAPFKGFLEPQVVFTHWTSPSLPAADTSTLGFGAAAVPGAALLGPGGCGSLPAWAAPGTPQGPVQVLEPQSHRGRGAEAPAAPVLPAPSPGNQHIKEVSPINIWSTGTPVGTTPGSNSPAGFNSALSSSRGLQSQGLGHPESDTGVTEETLLHEALPLLAVPQDMVDVPPARAGIKRGGSHFPTPPPKHRVPPGGIRREKF
ncbi:proline-rich protein 36-like [Neopsephotus bourkii]|uniref:proline-rich protein 36-like n=1 Tax=Neopsephotus bourkii TaxID=309878 RepID=UPI002AA567A5|nr:proline-rich protein 36-like [Neopsephotus bourkii]